MVLGFLSTDLLLTLQLDHIYSAWYFYALLGLLAASLAACTSTRQLPAIKVGGGGVNARSWGIAHARPHSTCPLSRVREVGACMYVLGRMYGACPCWCMSMNVRV